LTSPLPSAKAANVNRLEAMQDAICHHERRRWSRALIMSKDHAVRRKILRQPREFDFCPVATKSVLGHLELRFAVPVTNPTETHFIA
jgi:hypothetical protein